jgi:hypothetical protein
MVDVPAEMPVVIPVAEPITATEGLLLLHVPPALASKKGVVAPTHTVPLPVIGDIWPNAVEVNNMANNTSKCFFIKILSVGYKNTIQIY